MENQWKKMFQPHILQRGRKYFELGAVTKLVSEGDGFSARVKGSESYIVHVDPFDEQAFGAGCSCPYARRGEFCKHMAAVMFCLEANGFLEKEKAKNMESLEAVLARLSEDQLRKELLAFAAEQKSIRDHLMLRYAGENESQQLSRLKKEIARIRDKYAERINYCDWDDDEFDVEEFVADITNFLEKNAAVLLEKGEHMAAFDLIGEAFFAGEELELGSPGDELEGLSCACQEWWKKVYERCTPEERDTMLSWLMEKRLASIGKIYLEESLDDFIMNEFHSPAMLKKKIQYFDTLIERLSAQYEFSSYRRTEIEAAILDRLCLMRELGLPEEDVNAFKKKFWKYPLVRKQQVNEYLDDGKLAEAIALLKTCRTMDSDSYASVVSYTENLIELYRKNGMEKECKEELISRIFDYRINDLNYLFQLKELCTDEEWLEYRERTLSSDCSSDLKFQLLAQEGLYEQLLNAISESGSIWYLNSYEKILKPIFPERLRDFYMDYVIREAKSVSDRKRYHELAQYLKKISSYPDGQELAEGIASVWRSAYARRPAMMDELKNAGF